MTAIDIYLQAIQQEQRQRTAMIALGESLDRQVQENQETQRTIAAAIEYFSGKESAA